MQINLKAFLVFKLQLILQINNSRSKERLNFLSKQQDLPSGVAPLRRLQSYQAEEPRILLHQPKPQSQSHQ